MKFSASFLGKSAKKCDFRVPVGAQKSHFWGLPHTNSIMPNSFCPDMQKRKCDTESVTLRLAFLGTKKPQKHQKTAKGMN